MRYALLIPLLLAVAFVAGCVAQNAPTGHAVSGSDVIEFYSSTCPHCQNMVPVVAQAEADLGIKIIQLDVLDNATNRERFSSYEYLVTPACGGLYIPAFVNTKTGKAMCGEKSAAALEKFIMG